MTISALLISSVWTVISYTLSVAVRLCPPGTVMPPRRRFFADIHRVTVT